MQAEPGAPARWIVRADPARRRARRHAVGRHRRAAARPLQRQRDPGQPDAGLRGRACCWATWSTARGRIRRATTFRRPSPSLTPTAGAAAVRRLARQHRRADRAGWRWRRSGCSCSAPTRGFQLQVGGLAPAAARYAGFSSRTRAVDGAAAVGRHGRPGRRARGRRAARPAHAVRAGGLRLRRDHRRLRRPAAPGGHRASRRC